MTIEGHIKADVHPLPFVSHSHTTGIEINFNDPAAPDDRGTVLAELCESMVEGFEFASWDNREDGPTTVDIAVSPAFEGEFTRQHMDQVENDWDGRYGTVLAVRFDGSVGEAMREEVETDDTIELDEWRREWT
jgi:hypothetical protein